MFEKEAEEYLKAQCQKRKEEFVIKMPEVYIADIPQAFQDGAEFGYNKGKNEAKEIIQQLIANAPNTYSGTDIELEQKKMFSFQNAANKAEQFLKDTE